VIERLTRPYGYRNSRLAQWACYAQLPSCFLRFELSVDDCNDSPHKLLQETAIQYVHRGVLNLTSGSLVSGYQSFAETYRFHPQGQISILESRLKLELILQNSFVIVIGRNDADHSGRAV
jgi:hypothetical protein